MTKKYSFLVALGLLLAGLLLEYLYPLHALPPMRFPNSLYIGLALINVIGFLFFAYKAHPVVKWLGSVPAAISSIALLVFLTLLMGLIKQSNGHAELHTFGFHYIKYTWYLALALVYILVSLGLTTLRRIYPWRKGNLGFIINHLGLWIVLFAAFAGSNDLQRLDVQLQEGKTQWNAISAKGAHQLPCSIHLLDFELQEYAPELQLLQRHSTEIIKAAIDTTMHKQSLTLGDYHITLTQIIPSAHQDSVGYHHQDHPGSVFAAFAKIKDQDNNELTENWLSTKSFMYRPLDILINADTKLRLTTPDAQRYASKVIFNAQDTMTIEVNHPVRYAKHKFYQSSYDDTMGKWSQVSYLEMVYDPWLPLVYTGIFMLLLGSLFLLWDGNKNKNYD